MIAGGLTILIERSKGLGLLLSRFFTGCALYKWLGGYLVVEILARILGGHTKRMINIRKEISR